MLLKVGWPLGRQQRWVSLLGEAFVVPATGGQPVGQAGSERQRRRRTRPESRVLDEAVTLGREGRHWGLGLAYYRLSPASRMALHKRITQVVVNERVWAH